MTKILVIEDEDDIRENLVELLDAEGYETIAAENGKQGLEIAIAQIPDLIICDLLMPELDGYAVLEILRQQPATATIPLIILTAKVSRGDIRLGMELGADDYITKPYTRAEVLGAIATRLEKKAARERECQKKIDDLRINLTVSLPHELHTPLNGILNCSQLLIDEADCLEPSEILELAGDIRLSAERLYKLVQNFLLYVQLELLETQPEKLAALRQTSKTDAAKEAIAAAAIKIAKQWDRESDLHLNLQDAVVLISRTKLQKIVEELLDNACKFSPAKTPISGISYCENHHFVLEISDKGKGMTAEQIASIGAYMRFERKLSSQQGSGLGLAIAKRVTELYGGRLEIDSIPNQGTIVRVFLPV
jgi:two-component system, sensor histidine kinase and response regulator